MRSNLTRTLFAALSLTVIAVSVAAQKPLRDNLTAQEIDLVKEAQVLDKRTEVFIKAAERRLTAINNPAQPATKQSKKDAEKWGELPTGTRAELLSDLAKILDDAIVNIDDVSARDESNVLIPKALRKLSAAATTFIAQLSELDGRTKDADERAFIQQALENAQAIIDAANKLPPPTKKEKK
ncbi:MAG: hypothetical protein QOE77_1130 [Blastocatellia bacterium]|jgi:hypothetical protein|nr:hypothetical protein [Blastocatellia bacterium]